MEYRLKHISRLFETKSTWSALTEFMRFEAEAMGTVMNEEVKKAEEFDVQLKVKNERILSELE